MGFFQNNFTLTIPIVSSELSDLGNDRYIGLVPDPTPGAPLGSMVNAYLNGWDDFISHQNHIERREAFQEFIFIMFYSRNRRLYKAKFPHNVLYDKVLKYFVETNPLTVTALPAWGGSFTTEAPAFGASPSDNIFEEDFSGDYGTVRPINIAPSHLPALKPTVDINNIRRQIMIDILNGNTSIGFFQEVAAVFAYFYLIRQMVKINGHNWIFDNVFGGGYSSLTFNSRVVERQDSTETYGSTVSIRTNSIITEIDLKSKVELPYFFNSLMNKLASIGFNVPIRPDSGTITSSLYPTDADKFYIAQIVKILDPIRPLGGSATTHERTPSGSYAFNRLNGLTSKLSIDYSVPPLGIKVGEVNYNSFFGDLFNVIKCNHGIYPPLSPGAPTFYTSPSISYSSTTMGPVIDNDLKPIYDDIQVVVQAALQEEIRGFLSILLGDLNSTSIPESVIIGAGVGHTSISILGIQNFGLPFFNYKVDSDTKVFQKNEKVSSIDIKKKQVIHIGVYGLDLINGTSSKLEIKVDSIGTFKFEFPPGISTDLNFRTDIKVIPESIGDPNISLFYSQENTIDNSKDYFAKYTLIGSTTPRVFLVAKYYYARRDLVFRKFTDIEIDSYNIGSNSIKSIEYSITSNSIDPPPRNYEEFLTLISIFEDESPDSNLISDSAIYKSDTFELFRANQSNPVLPEQNKNSYDNLFNSRSDARTLEIIFDALKIDSSLTPGNEKVTLNLPSLLGSFVGQVSNLNDDRIIIADQTYSPKFNPSTNNQRDIDQYPLNVSEKALYNILKYSFGKITIIPTLNSTPPAALDVNLSIDLDIISHVNPSISHLDTAYSWSSQDLGVLNTKKNGVASNNQILAMLRSYGLLEGIVKRMYEILDDYPDTKYNVSEKAYIKDRLKKWLPEQGTSEADDLKCQDEDFGAVSPNLALDISLNEYYQLKRH